MSFQDNTAPVLPCPLGTACDIARETMAIEILELREHVRTLEDALIRSEHVSFSLRYPKRLAAAHTELRQHLTRLAEDLQRSAA